MSVTTPHDGCVNDSKKQGEDLGNASKRSVCCRACLSCVAVTLLALCIFLLSIYWDCLTLPIRQINPDQDSTVAADQQVDTRRADKVMSVLSYNVFLRSDPITAEDTAAENDFKEERMQALIALLDAYDVLLLQEVWTPLSDGRKGRLIRAAEAKGFRFWVRSACCGRPVDAMLLIMSRHPITDSGEFVFPGGVSNDMMASKGVLWARVKPSSASGRAIDMFTTHLQSGSDPEEKTTERRRQVSQLGDFVREKIETQAAGEEGGALIAGDFNVHGRTSMMNGTISEPYGAMITNLAMNTESGLQLTDLILHDQPASQRGELQITEPIWPKRLLEYNTSRDGGKALDYMFLVTQLGAREGSAGLGYFSPINGTCVVDPMAARSGEPFVTISDHFATNCRITY